MGSPGAGSSGAFGSGKSDPVGGLGEHSYDPDTGEANSLIGKMWGGFTGKHGPTAPRLPKGFEWLGPASQQLGQGALQNLSYDPSNAAGAAGLLGTGGQAGLAAGIGQSDVLGGFNQALQSLMRGSQTGFLPGAGTIADIENLLVPSLERSSERGGAAIREQGALTGNTSSSGLGQQFADFRGGLESNLGNQTANLYGSLLPQSMQLQGQTSNQLAQLPGMLAQLIYGPLASQGLQAQQFPLQAFGASTGAVGGAPFFANQGSSGNGMGPALMSMFMGGGGAGAGGGAGK